MNSPVDDVVLDREAGPGRATLQSATMDVVRQVAEQGGAVRELQIDRLSTVPYYHQLADALEQRITSGEIPVGHKLPSEYDLGQQYGLARATVREALRLLEERGLAQRVTNRGVFAARPSQDRGWVIQGPEGFLENAVGHQNHAVTTQVLSSKVVDLPAHATRSLQLPPRSRGFSLVRLRSVDGTPALFSTNYSPPALISVISSAERVLSGDASLSELLRRSGYPLGEAVREIRASAIPSTIAKHLKVSSGVPGLHIRSTSWTTEGLRYDVYDTWVRSDVIPLEIKVSANGW